MSVLEYSEALYHDWLSVYTRRNEEYGVLQAAPGWWHDIQRACCVCDTQIIITNIPHIRQRSKVTLLSSGITTRGVCKFISYWGKHFKKPFYFNRNVYAIWLYLIFRNYKSRSLSSPSTARHNAPCDGWVNIKMFETTTSKYIL